MLKKQAAKPQTKTAAKPAPASALKTTAIKRKASPAEEVIEEPAEEPEPEQEQPKSLKKVKVGARTSKSLADLFDNSKPKGIFPIGEFTGYISEIKLVGEIADDIEDQGPLAAIITFEAHEGEQDAEGNAIGGQTIDNRYTIVAKDGAFNEMGAGILRKDLDVLGYSEDVAILANLEQIFSDVTNERPAVVFKTQQNKQFVNAYLQGLAETN